MDIEKAKRLASNALDVVTQHGEEVRVAFYCSEEDLEWKSPTMVIEIVGNRARVAASTCLPSNGWAVVAEAYARAASFFRRAGLVDRLVETSKEPGNPGVL